MLAVVVLPLALVWLSDVGDRAAAQAIEIEVGETARSAATAWRTLPEEQARQRTIGLAQEGRARIRVVIDGQIVQDIDAEGTPWVDGFVSHLFFGPDAPTFTAADAAFPPLLDRPEVILAVANGASKRCAQSDAGPVLVCAAARVITTGTASPASFGSSPPATGPQRTVLVHAQTGSRRALRALHDARYPMIKLTLDMLVIGVLLAVWLDLRMVAPVVQLRDQMRAGRRRGKALPVVHDRTDEIGDLAGAYNELIAMIDDRNAQNAAFVADLAHELKNPVAAVRAAAEALGGGRSIDEERARRLSTVLIDSSRRLDALVTQFLELARAEAGLPDRERGPVDLYALAVGICEAVNAREGGSRVIVEGSTAIVDGVSERLESVIRNLVDNAVSFAGPDGRVAVGVRIVGSEAIVRVDDTGPGIAPEDVPRVFERFFSRRGDGSGTGLGLALVRAIAEAHGGRVNVRSRVGEGASFEVAVPVGAA